MVIARQNSNTTFDDNEALGVGRDRAKGLNASASLIYRVDHRIPPRFKLDMLGGSN